MKNLNSDKPALDVINLFDKILQLLDEFIEDKNI